MGSSPGCFAGRAANRRERIYRLTLAFVIYLLGHRKIRRQKALPSHVAAVRDAVNRDPAHPWSGATFADMVLMSPDGLTRSFRRWMGMTPTEYVQQVRVREACRLLSQTDATIDAVARTVGFPDRFYFSRVFKKHTNVPPAQVSEGSGREGGERGGGDWGVTGTAEFRDGNTYAILDPRTLAGVHLRNSC